MGSTESREAREVRAESPGDTFRGGYKHLIHYLFFPPKRRRKDPETHWNYAKT